MDDDAKTVCSNASSARSPGGGKRNAKPQKGVRDFFPSATTHLDGEPIAAVDFYKFKDAMLESFDRLCETMTGDKAPHTALRAKLLKLPTPDVNLSAEIDESIEKYLKTMRAIQTENELVKKFTKKDKASVEALKETHNSLINELKAAETKLAEHSDAVVFMLGKKPTANRQTQGQARYQKGKVYVSGIIYSYMCLRGFWGWEQMHETKSASPGLRIHYVLYGELCSIVCSLRI